ncbi:hypothetical protein LTR53_000442 [Teratosphaeriaceae sp. CCFEE 6253]|nr:hypothetical protein LTR53_000442 [Teratosphaeriaceae sp. CCFEE 6253]
MDTSRKHQRGSSSPGEGPEAKRTDLDSGDDVVVYDTDEDVVDYDTDEDAEMLDVADPNDAAEQASILAAATSNVPAAAKVTKPGMSAVKKLITKTVTDLEKEGKKYSLQHEAGVAMYGTKDERNRAWIDLMANYLAREIHFVTYMQRPPPPESIRLERVWLASIHVPLRYKEFGTFSTWYSKFYIPCRMHILEKAREIIDAVEPIPAPHLDTLIDPPPMDDAADTVRRTIYEYQQLRLQWQATIRIGTDLEHQLMRRFFVEEGKKNESNRAFFEDTANELNLIEDMKEELRDLLGSSMVNANGREILDKLLSQAPPSRGLL